MLWVHMGSTAHARPVDDIWMETILGLVRLALERDCTRGHLSLPFFGGATSVNELQSEWQRIPRLACGAVATGLGRDTCKSRYNSNTCGERPT